MKCRQLPRARAHIHEEIVLAQSLTEYFTTNAHTNVVGHFVILDSAQQAVGVVGVRLTNEYCENNVGPKSCGESREETSCIYISTYL